MGLVYRAIKSYPEAIASYQQAIALDPEDAAAHYNLGVVYYTIESFNKEMAKLEEAERFARKACRIDPWLASPWCLRAIISAHPSQRNYLYAQILWQRYEYVARQTKQDIGDQLTNLLSFFTNIDAPFFLYRIITQYPILAELYSWQILVQKTLEQARPLRRWLATFIRQHRTSDPLITTKVQAIITFYAGDPSFAYEQLDERETLEAEQDLQFQYYMQLSALNFHHTKERMHITEGGASIARELLNANTQPSSDEHVRQWYYAGRFLWHHQAYQEAIQCWEKVSHFPPALYMLMYGYHQQQMMPERNDVVSRIIAMEQQGVGLVSHVKPVLLGLESSVSTTQDTIFRYVYAREIAETLDVLAECVTQQHSFVADFRSALASSVTDIWTIPPTTLEKIDHYETEALNHAIQHLADTIKRHSDLVAEWLKEGLPQKIVPKVGALITDSYNENLIHQELNSDLLTYLFLSKQINYYDRLFLEVWNRVVELKKRRFHPLTEETVKAAVAIAMTLATPKVLAGIEDDAVTLPINNFLIQLSPIFALVVINYINHRISVGKVSDIEDNYSEFRNQFAIYIENTKEELGEEKFYERYPLAGFDEWVKQS